MKNQIEVLLQVAGVLDDLRVPYLVVGSVASSLLGVSRATADVDVVADLRAEQTAAFVEATKEEFYVDDLAVRRAVAARRAFNLVHFDSLFKVDIYLPGSDDFSLQELSRRRPEMLLPGGRAVYVATPEDVILSKLRWHLRGGLSSERQLEDAAGVIKVQGDGLDFEYLREWADRLGVSDLLEQLLKR
jgi:hypothetical protein